MYQNYGEVIHKIALFYVFSLLEKKRLTIIDKQLYIH